MNENNTIEKMKQMRMDTMADLYHQHLTEHLYQNMSTDELLTFLIDNEWEARQNKSIDNLIRLANFKQMAAAMDIPDNTDPRSGHIDPSKNGFGTIIC